MAQKKRIIFDLDGTLVDSKEAKVFLRSSYGRDYAANNINSIDTKLYDPNTPLLIKKLIDEEKWVTVVTDSPEDYAKSLLDKHGFPVGKMAVVGNANKPSKKNFRRCLPFAYNSLIVGDSPKDILFAHELQNPSVGVSWGYFLERRINRAEPNFIIDDLDELEEIIEDYYNGNIQHQERTRPSKYRFHEYTDNDPQFEKHLHLMDYYPYHRSSRNFYNSGSNKILTYKRCKEHTRKEINNKIRDVYYGSNGFKDDRHYDVFFDVVIDYVHQALDKIDNLNLQGNSLMMAAPSSIPWYCNICDINQRFAITVSDNSDDLMEVKKRFFYRVYPKDASHVTGNRSEEKHFQTIGMLRPLSENIDNIIIFDDVSKTYSQINSLGKMLRQEGFNGNLYSLVLGKTIE